ncbi:MAG TPA: hypothetical protein VGD76_12050 [Ramlibacter sp.]
MGAPKYLMLRRIAFVAVLAAGSHGALAQDAKGQAVQAAIADGVSTAAVVATGVISVNPLSPVLSFGLSAATLQYAESLPEKDRPAVYASATAMWAGTTVNNVCITAAFLTSGGSLLPVCLALGVAWGMKTWNDGEQERFRQACPSLRDFAQLPNFECVDLDPRVQAAEAPRALISAGELTAP